MSDDRVVVILGCVVNLARERTVFILQVIARPQYVHMYTLYNDTALARAHKIRPGGGYYRVSGRRAKGLPLSKTYT